MAIAPEIVNPAAAVDDLRHIREVEARVLAGAAQRINEQLERARQLGLIDEHGNRLFSDLPEDMQPGAQRDFGG
jgi:hypothetical protein